MAKKKPAGNRTSGTTQLNVEVPPAVKSRLEKWADTYGRSLTTECLIAFHRHFEAGPVIEIPEELRTKRRGRPSTEKK